MPQDLQLALNIALEYSKGGQPEQAEAIYRQQLAVHSHQPVLLGQLADFLMERGDFQLALPLLVQARALAPEQVQFWMLQTQCLLGLDRAKEAKKLISEAIAKGLRHPRADELLKKARTDSKAKEKPRKTIPVNEALRHVGNLLQAGKYGEAERLGEEYRRSYPREPQMWYVSAMASLMQGRSLEAIPLFEQALVLDPGMSHALYNLGVALDGVGRLEDATEVYRRAIARVPQLPESHNNLGHVLQKLGRHEEALSAFDQALALRPNAAEIHMNRANALRDLERLDESVEAYRAALKYKPHLVEAHVNLAVVLLMLDRAEESLLESGCVIARKPNEYAAWQNQGKALQRLKRPDEAVAAFENALKYKPDDAEIWKDLGSAQRDTGRFGDAIEAFQKAVVLRPDFGVAINLLAGVLLDVGRQEESLAMYRRGLALEPDAAFVIHSNMLLGLNYQSSISSDLLLGEALAFGKKAAQKAGEHLAHDNVPNPTRRLRVGMVSGDLGLHPVGYFLRDVLENLDPAQVELYAYATTKRSDALNTRLRRSFSHWCEVADLALDDKMLARRIQSDGVDILIDLAGHTAKNRLPVFAWKPAPVQVTWLGYLGTTGLESMDYLLADAWALPVGEEDQFIETPWRMPESYICFSEPDVTVEVGPLLARDKGRVTFGCFNNLNKVTDQVVDVWARLLHAVPSSQLFLKTKSLRAPEVCRNLTDKFGRCGIGRDRLILEGKFSSAEEHYKSYHMVDIALDPFPYPGITTTMEALWMGVPVVTMRGNRFISHQGETIMHNLGLLQWIADSEDDYVMKAAKFAQDIGGLAQLRTGLRQKLLLSPLCDAPRFARNFEAALRGMWQRWCIKQQSGGE